MTQVRILLTAFEPFAGARRNPSADVVSRIGRGTLRGVEIHSAVLPVSARRAPGHLARELEAWQPDHVLSLGEARNAREIRVERFARNALEFALPDNDGLSLAAQPISTSGPAVRASGLPVLAMCEALVALGVPCTLSEDAGRFICNLVFYEALAWCDRSRALGGFVHLPPVGAAPDGLPLELEVRAVSELVRMLAEDALPAARRERSPASQSVAKLT